jgi:hypothetical protein
MVCSGLNKLIMLRTLSQPQYDSISGFINSWHWAPEIISISSTLQDLSLHILYLGFNLKNLLCVWDQFLIE